MNAIFFSKKFPGIVFQQEGGIHLYHTKHPPVWWKGMVAANMDVNCSYKPLYGAFSPTWPADLASNVIGTKKMMLLEQKEFSSHRIGLEHQYGRLLICLEHLHGCCNFM